MTGQEQAVMQTSNDALLTKVMAESLGYFKDPYCRPFSNQKRKLFPIINRGTWARVYSIRQIVTRFVQQGPCNIVSLGCGYDSTFFWLQDQQLQKDICYIEIDYPDVVARKTKVIKETSLLYSQLPSLAIDGSIDTPSYKLFAADVRDLDTINANLHNVDKTRPTLVITECLLVYMTSQDSLTILKGFSDIFERIAFVNYEMINPDDKFGRQMVENIEMRGCSLLGLHDCPSLDAQKARMQQVLGGECSVESLSMATVYNEKLNDTQERSRVEKLEMFDEWEEWTMLQEHYCLTLGCRGINLSI